MKISKFIIKNKRKYIFVKRCNKNLFLYEDMSNGFKECFTRSDLGLVEETILAHRNDIHPERKYLCG